MEYPYCGFDYGDVVYQSQKLCKTKIYCPNKKTLYCHINESFSHNQPTLFPVINISVLYP